jgi:glycosyltransferase involved in cell wall biosynthesis
MLKGNNMPTVSVITPAYNNTDKQYDISLGSIESQTCKDFEWIVVGDGCIGNKFQHWTDVRTEKNYGPSVARNLGFQISSGKIITYLDMGDELDHHRIKNLITLFETYHSDLIFSAYYIDPPMEFFDHFTWLGTQHFPTAFEYIQILERQNISIPLGVAHTRRPFVLNGGFQRGIVCGEDGILWRRMLKSIPQGNVLFSNDVAGIYHINPNGQSRTQRRFEMGGFAFDGSKNDNGQYLDKEWYATFGSEGLYD